MLLFATSVALVLGISALCSLTEAALYSVRVPYARQLAESGSRSGRALLEMLGNMDRPITTILVVNTVANTAGAALAGAQAERLFAGQTVYGYPFTLVFFVAFTLSVLLFSEILPKVTGVAYGRSIARVMALPLAAAIWVLWPLVRIAQMGTRLVQRNGTEPLAPEEEVHQMATMSAEEGSILPMEAELVKNVLQLNEILAKDIMTPRTVVYTLAAERPVADLLDEMGAIPYTRIPIYEDDPENWVGLVLKNDILACLARDEFDTPLAQLQKPLKFVPETVPGHRLLRTFLAQREHLLGVLDEYGGMRGVVSLEDVMESVIGSEIVDETDVITDLQQVARIQGSRRLGQSPLLLK